MSDQNFLEVEVKLLVDDLDTVAARLVAAGAEKVVPRVFERNVRYENEDRTLTQSGIVLRLRQDRLVRLTYKEPVVQTEDDLASRFEAEVEVKEFHTMNLILRKLGFHPFMEYEKYRTTYTLDGAEIVLDEMPYGSFVEVEGRPDAIRAVLKRLGLDHSARYLCNYLLLFERVKARLGLEFADLTFANFEGVDVPRDAFGAPDNQEL